MHARRSVTAITAAWDLANVGQELTVRDRLHVAHAGTGQMAASGSRQARRWLASTTGCSGARRTRRAYPTRKGRRRARSASPEWWGRCSARRRRGPRTGDGERHGLRPARLYGGARPCGRDGRPCLLGRSTRGRPQPSRDRPRHLRSVEARAHLAGQIETAIIWCDQVSVGDGLNAQELSRCGACVKNLAKSVALRRCVPS